MTKTTPVRQLRETIGEVLKANGVDSLKIDADVCAAVLKFFADTKAGRDPVTVRREISEAYWDGLKGEMPREKMRQRIMDALKLNLSENPAWDSVVSHCLNREAKGETVEQYAAACSANPYGMPKPFQMAERPGLIISTWPQAFPKTAPKREGNELYV